MVSYKGSASYNGFVFVVPSDGSGLRDISTVNGNYEVTYSPDFSPDGAGLVYATYRHRMSGVTDDFVCQTRNFEIETSLLDGTNRQRITHNASLDTAPVWSPDGARVAFVKGWPHYDESEGGIYTIKPDGTEERPVVLDMSILSLTWGPTWSPDGNTLAFGGKAFIIRDPNPPAYNSLYTVEADGSGLRRLFADTESTYPSYVAELKNTTWSPDGQRIAFSSATLRDNGAGGFKWVFRVYIVGRDGDGLQEIPIASELVSVGVNSLEWSPDGSEILLSSIGGVFLIDTEDFEIRKILDRSDVYAAWSPDGSRIAVFSQGRDDWLVSMQKDGSDVRVLMRLDEDGRVVAGNPR